MFTISIMKIGMQNRPKSLKRPVHKTCFYCHTKCHSFYILEFNNPLKKQLKWHLQFLYRLAVYVNNILIINSINQNPDLRISSVQYELITPMHRNFTPESRRSLLLRSSSLRLKYWEQRTEDRTSQLLSVRLHTLNLKDTHKENTSFTVY